MTLDSVSQAKSRVISVHSWYLTSFVYPPCFSVYLSIFFCLPSFQNLYKILFWFPVIPLLSFGLPSALNKNIFCFSREPAGFLLSKGEWRVTLTFPFLHIGLHRLDHLSECPVSFRDPFVFLSLGSVKVVSFTLPLACPPLLCL